MDMITVKAPAKINLGLEIIGLDEHGYHQLRMVMQTIDLYDYVTVSRKSSPGITMESSDPDVPCDSHNICYTCAEVFFRQTGIQNTGIHIIIEKNIPMQSGMAGGSADGAGTLVALNTLFHTGLSLEDLCRIGKLAGADVPFCIAGGTALVEGIGEQITPLPALCGAELVIAKPKGGISTQRAFADYDALPGKPAVSISPLVDAVKREQWHEVPGLMTNALEQVCSLSDVAVIKNIMLSSGAKGAMMTGSGSAVFGIFPSRSKAFSCERRLAERYPETFICKAVPHGAVIV